MFLRICDAKRKLKKKILWLIRNGLAQKKNKIKREIYNESVTLNNDKKRSKF